MTKNDIPAEPLDVRDNTWGFLPNIGLHGKQGVFHQESSYSYFWFLGVMLAAAAVVFMLPWETRTALGKLKYWVGGGLIWGGICALVPYFVRNVLGQTIVIDPRKETVLIRERGSEQLIPWSEIVALQVCYQPSPGRRIGPGYQLNIAWRDQSGEVHRHCLLKHVIKRFVVSLGKRYSSRFGFEIVDHSRNEPTQASRVRGDARR